MTDQSRTEIATREQMQQIADFATELEIFCVGREAWLVVAAIGVMIGGLYGNPEDAVEALHAAEQFTDHDSMGIMRCGAASPQQH
jgi:hypothetical protein